MINQAYHGHFARKRFGQHFLNDQCVIDRIVFAINPQKDQAIVEIGPGLAALTEPIGKHLDKLIVIELDHDLVVRLKMHPFLRGKLTIYQQDAMTINFDKIAKKIGKPLRIYGSLPYNISTALIFKLLSYTDTIVDMHFILQKEVANRLIAKPNNKEYGRLTVMVQCFCQVIPIFEVSPLSFTPSPKVNSAVVRLMPYQKIPYPVQDFHSLSLITAEAFNQRRKMIRHSLSKFFTVEILVKLGMDPTTRAENISIEQYCKLANYISNNLLPKENY